MNKIFNLVIEIVKSIIIDGNIYISRKNIDAVCYYIIPFVLLCISIFSFNFNIGSFYELGKDIGEFGFNLLLFILFIKPLYVYFPKIKLLSKIVFLRRELGIIIFYFVFIHGVSKMIQFDLFNWNNFINIMVFDNFLFYGFVSLFLMFILYVTSNKFSMILLKKNWKLMQRLSYFALFITIIHVTMFKDEIFYYIVFGIYVVMKGIEFKIVRNRKLEFFKNNDNMK